MAVNYKAQLATLVDEPPSGAQWLHELKLDGYRIGVFVERDGVRLMSRRGTEWTRDFPELVASARKLRSRDTVIDGEVVMLTEGGVSSFEALQNRGKSRGGLAYFAFDLLTLNGRDVSKLPLVERKQLLLELIGDGVGIIRYTQHFDGDGRAVLDQACALGAEGIVSKRRDAPYRPGARHDDWRKSKCSKRQEFVVGGFTDPSGSRVGVGSMLIGYYEGDELRFAGKVGTGRGWSASFGRDLRKRLERLAQDACPFNPRPPGWLGRNAHWVKPTEMVEVEFTEWTAGGHIRHPSLKGFRRDKDARDVVRERTAAPAATRAAAPRQRVHYVYPRLRFSRDDLVALYRDIGDWVLPHARNRPLTLVRCQQPITKPDALRSQCTFIRHAERDSAWAPPELPRVRIREKKKVGHYLYVETIDGLLALLERGVVEWHVWNACADDIEHPDRIVFDLDPGAGTTWKDVVTAARRVRQTLEKLGLESWPKTTGGHGLHVVVPFRAEHDWDTVFAFSRVVAEHVTQAHPKAYTLDFGKTQRAGKLLLDYKRNYRTSIAVAGFSTRAKPTGTIAVPLRWSDVTARLDPESFTVKTIAKRLARLSEDPWVDYWTCSQRLTLASQD
jgi:bifunctional non-homologous end joining protein LigD